MNSYYRKGCVEIYLGETLEVLNNLNPKIFDVIYADPPYFLSNDGITCSSGKRSTVNKGNWDKSRGVELDYQFHLDWINACKRVLNDNGSLWVSGSYHSIYLCGCALW